MRTLFLFVALVVTFTSIPRSDAHGQQPPARPQPQVQAVVDSLLVHRGELELTERQASELRKLSDRLRVGHGRLRLVRPGGAPGKAEVPRFMWVRQTRSSVQRLAFRILTPEQRGRAASLLNGLEPK